MGASARLVGHKAQLEVLVAAANWSGRAPDVPSMLTANSGSSAPHGSGCNNVHDCYSVNNGDK